MINIAEILKDCPKGMELECSMFDDVKFIGVEKDDKPICIRTGDIYRYLTKFGAWTFDENAKCVIFPKGKNTWEGFIPPCKFKDGDIVATTTGNWIGITTGGDSGGYMPTYCVVKSNGEFEAYFDHKGRWKFDRFATEEEKAKLFQTIKVFGYRWDSKTKTLEKLIVPKFKVGDRIKHIVGREEFATIIGVKELHYNLDSKVGTSAFSISLQREWELVPNKFDINSLKPFDKVLVRGDVGQRWIIDFFGFMDNKKGFPFVCVGHYVAQCIPYEGNEHLLGTTDDCEEFYKN